LTLPGAAPKMPPLPLRRTTKNMNPLQPEDARPMPLTEELEARLLALRKLRRQMLTLHARLEYLRLMLRLNARVTPQEPPLGDAP
jgi:hypothetical protein